MSWESLAKPTNLFSRRWNEFRRLHTKVNPLFTPKHALILMLLEVTSGIPERAVLRVVLLNITGKGAENEATKLTDHSVQDNEDKSSM